jgi:hypothetical protein
LIAYWFDEDKPRSGRTTVDVINADIEGVTVTVAAGPNIEGRILWSGPPSIKEDELSVSLRTAEVNFGFDGQARVTQDGTFSLKDVAEGTYEVSVSGQSKNCYIKRVQYGEHDALENGLTMIRGSPAALEIIISSRGASVQGRALDHESLPATGVWVVLVPRSASRAKGRLNKSVTTDQNGHFDIRGIPPGEYKLFSWDDVEQDAWEDPDFLKEFEEKGKRVEFKEGDQRTVELNTIPAASPENVKP